VQAVDGESDDKGVVSSNLRFFVGLSLQGFLHSLENADPDLPHPEASQGGVSFAERLLLATSAPFEKGLSFI
jgi:hypothetical protein